MFFPIKDDNRGITKPTYVTWALIALNIVVFLLQLNNENLTYAYSTIPKEITTGVDLVSTEYITVNNTQHPIPQLPGPGWIYFTLFSSMFMHGGMGHIFGNMLYLWIFGNNVEHRFGSFKFLLFYLLSGLAAHALQIGLQPDSVIPNLGASGAISGVMGAYLVLFPKNRVYAVILFHMMTVPAIVVLGLWVAMQFWNGFGSIMAPTGGGGVAYGAHIGGLLAGVLIACIVRMMMKSEPDTAMARIYREDPKVRSSIL